MYFSHVTPPLRAPAWLQVFMASGYMGVTVFFVLSGFVLSLNYFDQLSAPNPSKLARYAVARFARIYPLYIAVLAWVVLRRNALAQSAEGWGWHVAALQAWKGDIQVAYGFNPPAWSVSVECFLYACFPAVVVCLRRIRATKALILAAVGVIGALFLVTLWFRLARNEPGVPATLSTGHRWLYRNPLSRLGDFTLGVIAARIVLNLRGSRLAHRARWLVLAGLLVMLRLMTSRSLYLTIWSFDVVYAVPAVLVIAGLALAPRGLIARFLSLPPVVVLGEVSFAFYLIHYLMIPYLDIGAWTATWSGSVLLLEFFKLCIVVALAIGLHHMIERPGRQLVRRLVTSRAATKPAAMSPIHQVVDGPPAVTLTD